MSSHFCSVFANSCVKQPIDPKNKHPVTKYERPVSYLYNEMEALKIGDSKQKDSGQESDLGKRANVRSIVDFYDSIPEYNDVSHLSERDFYAKLDSLRDTCTKLKRYSASVDSLERILDDYIETDSICMDITTHSRKSSTRHENMFRKSVSPIGSRLSSSASIPYKMSYRDIPKKPKNSAAVRSESNISFERKKFKANSVPYTSKFLLYNQIMEDQKLKSQIAKLDSALELQSKIRPFHFSERKSRCPSAMSMRDNKIKSEESFKEKSLPKKQFSNYFTDKDWEEEYFRSLKKHIRAEQLIKMSSFPPSMEKRLRKKSSKSKRKTKRNNNSFLLKSNNEIESKTESQSNHDTSPLPTHPVARPNLAATLRNKVSRKKLEQLSDDAVSPTPSHRFDWGVRKTTAWKSLGYCETNDEDISMRLATRRAEQKLLREEYDLNMEIMRQRVKSAPLLLEGLGASYAKIGKVSHCCVKNNKSASPTKFIKKSSRKSPLAERNTLRTKPICMLHNQNTNIKIDNSDSEVSSEDRAFL